MGSFGERVAADVIDTKVVPKPSFVDKVIQSGVKSGATMPQTGANAAKFAGALAKVAQFAMAAGIALEAAFALSCR